MLPVPKLQSKSITLCGYALALLFFLPNNIQARRWYEVEIIIFEQITEQRLESEIWDQSTALVELSNSRDFLTQPPHLTELQQLCLDGQFYSLKPLTSIEELPLYEEVITAETDELKPTEQTIDDSDLTEDISEEESPFILLTDSERKLQPIYQQLRRRRGYRMLFHEAWRQPMASKADSLPVRIYAGKNYGETYNYQGDSKVELAELTIQEQLAAEEEAQRFNELSFNSESLISDNDSILESVDEETTSQERAAQAINKCATIIEQQNSKKQDDVWQLDGYIHLYAERFRHFDTNLSLRIPGKEEIDLRAIATNLAAEDFLSNVNLNDEPKQEIFNWQFSDDFLTPKDNNDIIIRDVLKHYNMNQSRRIINEKVHYLDHPLFGLIIQMRSYDPDQPDEELLN